MIRIQVQPREEEPESPVPARVHTATLKEGDIITFDATGERLRVSRIDRDEVVLVRLP